MNSMPTKGRERRLKQAVNPAYTGYVGLLVHAAWVTPPERKEQLMKSGRVVPEYIDGYLNVDTGAGNMGINANVAEELGLGTYGELRDVGTAMGVNTRTLYAAGLILPCYDDAGQKTQIALGAVPIQIDGMDDSTEIRELNTATHRETRYIGLLGRLFLQHTRLIYDGMTGEYEIRFYKEDLPEVLLPAANFPDI